MKSNYFLLFGLSMLIACQSQLVEENQIFNRPNPERERIKMMKTLPNLVVITADSTFDKYKKAIVWAALDSIGNLYLNTADNANGENFGYTYFFMNKNEHHFRFSWRDVSRANLFYKHLDSLGFKAQIKNERNANDE